MDRSSAKAEYGALIALTSELLWLNQLLRAFEIHPNNSMVFCEIHTAIQLANNPIAHAKLNHIDIDCHFIREHVLLGFLKIIHVPSQHQLVDPMTKRNTQATLHISHI